MMKRSIFAIILVALRVLGVLPIGAQAEEETAEFGGLGNVYDADDLLSDAEEEEIDAALQQASEQTGVRVCAYLYCGNWFEELPKEYYRELLGFGNDTAILMVVEQTAFETYYLLYTFEDADYQINGKEIDYILDDSTVYYNLKDDAYVEGLCAYAELAAQAYAGRLGVSWVLILIVALIVGAIAGGISVSSIAASYKKKNPSQSYPLDRFAKLELTRERDHEIGKFVTTTIISSGSRPGHGGGGVGRGGGARGAR